MQNIYSISVKNEQKLETLLRVEIERKLTIFEKKTFWSKFFFSFVFFFEILKFQNQIFLSFLVFHQKNIFSPIEICYCFQEKILRSIERTQRRSYTVIRPIRVFVLPNKGGGGGGQIFFCTLFFFQIFF